MLCAPAGGILLEDKRAATDALMRAGAPIHELNCVRKHLSCLKGGQLALRAGRLLTLAISDVHWPVEDDPSVIGGGPTVGDPTTFADALAVAGRASDLPWSVLDRLRRGASGEIAETPAPDDPRLRDSAFVVIGTRRTALTGAAAEAARLGYDAVVLPAVTHGEAREEGRAFASRALALARAAGRPLCVLAAGETTVHVVGRGRGGRNQEFALAAASELAGISAPLLAASAGTDGRDGPTDAAGAFADDTTMARAAARGLDAAAALAANDAYPFLAALGDLILSGPTGTNVGDLHLLLALPGSGSAANPATDTHP
jgi:glycerate-2-kinase